MSRLLELLEDERESRAAFEAAQVCMYTSGQPDLNAACKVIFARRHWQTAHDALTQYAMRLERDLDLANKRVAAFEQQLHMEHLS